MRKQFKFTFKNLLRYLQRRWLTFCVLEMTCRCGRKVWNRFISSFYNLSPLQTLQHSFQYCDIPVFILSIWSFLTKRSTLKKSKILHYWIKLWKGKISSFVEQSHYVTPNNDIRRNISLMKILLFDLNNPPCVRVNRYNLKKILYRFKHPI